MNYNKYNSWSAYRLAQLKNNGLWNIAMRTVRYARRYFLISRIIRYASYLTAVIETSAVLILFFSALLVLLPIILILVTISTIIGIASYRKYNKLISKDVRYADNVIVIDARQGYFRKRVRYLNTMAKCFRDEGYSVIVVSHSLINDRFLTAKKAEDGIWVVRLSYFFSLKKQLDNENTAYIY